jgi:hypothetical protein
MCEEFHHGGRLVHRIHSWPRTTNDSPYWYSSFARCDAGCQGPAPPVWLFLPGDCVVTGVLCVPWQIGRRGCTIGGSEGVSLEVVFTLTFLGKVIYQRDFLQQVLP